MEDARNAADVLVVAADRFAPPQRKRLEDALPGARFDYLPLEAERLPAPTQIVIGAYRPQAVKPLPRLALLQLTSAGYERYLSPGVLRRDTILANASGAFDQSVSEHVLACLLSLLKRLPGYRDNQHRHVWKDLGTVGTLADSRVLIIGAGHIGVALGRLCAALGRA